MFHSTTPRTCTRPSHNERRNRSHPWLEALERRCLLSAAVDRSGVISADDPFTSADESAIVWEAGAGLSPISSYDSKTGQASGAAGAKLSDVTLLHVDVDPTVYGEQPFRPGGVLVSILSTPETPTSANFDMYIYESDANGTRGELVGSARNWQDLPEATAVLQGSGYYLIEVVYANVPLSDDSVSESTAMEESDLDVSLPLFRLETRFVHPDDWSPRVGVEALGLRPFRHLTQATTTPEFDDTSNFVGLIESFDGLTLSSRVIVPTETQLSTINEPQPLPMVLWQVGFPGQRSGLNRVFPSPLVNSGYALASFAVRGLDGSCGPASVHVLSTPSNIPADVETPRGPGGDPTCAAGYAHIVDREYEVRDAQHILAVLVHYGIADSQRLGMGGESWGGGLAWMLAASLPWPSPFDGRPLQLAAALPNSGWTDFQYAFIPNGRATDALDQSPSHERPFGVVTDRLSAGKLVADAVYRMNHDDPAELHSYSDGWWAFIEAGEPYDDSSITVPNPSRPGETVTITAKTLSEALRSKSAYYSEDYFRELAAGTIEPFEPVPIFAIQGWTDASFPVVQSLQMYRKLKAADPDYPIWMSFGDVGHEIATNPQPVLTDIFTKAKEFLDFYLKDVGQPRTDRIVSYETQYPKPTVLPPAIRGTDWDSMVRGAIRLTKGADDTRTTIWGPPNAAEEVKTDPIVARHQPITQPAGTYVDLADWTWDVPEDGFTLLGLPRVTLNYQMLLGDHAMIAAKLWDVDIAENRTLITRGVYRLSLAGGDASSGTLTFQLFGNHYKLQPGHKITLELSQTDASYLQPDKLPSSILFSAPELTLPTVEPTADLQTASIAATSGRAPQGEKVTLSAVIANTGTVAVAPSQTAFRLDGTTLLGLIDTPAIPAGGAATVVLQWDTRGVKGTHTIEVIADQTGMIAESNEDNNAATLTVHVQGNKVTNGSFDQSNADGSGPEGWTASSTAAGTSSWNADTGSVSFIGTGGNTLSDGSPTWISNSIDVTAGQILQLSATVSSIAASSPATVSVVYLDANQQVLNTSLVLSIPSTTDGFISLVEQVIVPTGAASVRILLTGFALIDHSTSGEVIFDEIWLSSV